MAADHDLWRDRINSYSDLYSVNLAPIANEPLRSIFGTDPIATFDVDMTLWSFLIARGLTNESATPPDLDDMEWLIPGDPPAGTEDLTWANDAFTSRDHDVVNFGAVDRTVGDVLGNDVRTATEVYDRLWHFIYERKLVLRTAPV